jgi:hypothetical protein
MARGGGAPPVQPAPEEEEEEMYVVIPPRVDATSQDVGVSFNGGHAIKSVGFCADPGRYGEDKTVIIRAVGHWTGGDWWVPPDVVITKATPKVVLQVPDGIDGMSFMRKDDLPIHVEPNFEPR